LKIFLPFSVVLVLATVLAWWVATSLLTATLERRLEQQLEHAALVLAGGEFPFTEELLSRLAKLLKAEIVLIRKDGTVGASTLPEQDRAVLKGIRQRAWQEPHVFTLQLGSIPYQWVVQPLPEGRDARYTAVVVLASLGDIGAAARHAAAWLGGAAGLGLLTLAWIGHQITRSITVPIQELGQMAERIAGGDRNVRVQVAQANEIGVLAEALNTMAERLSVYEAEIAETSRLAAIGQTTARIAHEIRNPLTAIKLQVQLLQETVGPEQQKQTMTSSLLDEIRRLDLIVSSTLDLSCPVRLVKQAADLNLLAAEVAQLSAAQFAHRGIRLELVLTPQLPEVTVDAARIKQLLWNLLVNASDELPQGGIIRLSIVAQQDGMMLVIEDSGPGIPEDRRATLFSASASHKPGGLGLGLPLSKEIAELHGGHIDVGDSELGGARFCVSLPVNQP
jgi:signal transduction histidine kinase